MKSAFRLTLAASLYFMGATATAKGFDARPYFGQLIPSQAAIISLEPQTPNLAATVRVFCTVRPGDTLAGIAARFGTTSRAVKLANGMTKDTLRPGVTLQVPLEHSLAQANTREVRLPPGARWHTVRRGETLSGLSKANDLEQIDLINANPQIRSLDQVKTGERFIIPGQQHGSYVQLKAGQSLLDLAGQYGLELDDLIVANAIRDLRSLQSGDYVVLPDVDASSTAKRLEQRRAAEAAIETQLLFELAKQRKAEAKLALAAQQRRTAAAAASSANDTRARLRTAQRTQTTRVRRASANFSFPSYGGGYIWPMRGVITSGFGTRGFWIGSSNFHTGLDIATGYGTPIYAAHSGYVEQAGFGYFGLNVWVSVGNGVENIYGHMSRIAVYAGSYIQRGQLVGYEGCSGICTGPHLHFEVRVGGRPVNPLRYLP